MGKIGFGTETKRRRSPLKVVASGDVKPIMAMNPLSNAPTIGDERRINQSEPWVRFGNSNLFPEFVRALADNTPALDPSIERLALFVAGNGMEFLNEGGEEDTACVKKWKEVWGEAGEEALLHATAMDKSLLGAFSWDVINSRTGPVQLHHMDVARMRLGKRGEDGKVGMCYWSSNWFKHTDPLYKPVALPSFGVKGAARGILYSKNYKQLRDYYGEPHWLSVMADAEVLARIPVFNRSQLDMGFKPAVHAHLITNQDAEDYDQIDEKFEEIYTGASGKGYILTMASTGEILKIDKLERGDHAGELDATRKVSKEEIYHTVGVPAILMGVDVSTGLSGKGLAITETVSMFQNTVVAPMQKSICHAARRVMNACGLDPFEVKIRPLVPFEPAKDPVLARQAYIASTLVNEDRVARGQEPLPDNDPRGMLLLCEALKGSGATNTKDADS
jgi:hypothetical protein